MLPSGLPAVDSLVEGNAGDMERGVPSRESRPSGSSSLSSSLVCPPSTAICGAATHTTIAGRSFPSTTALLCLRRRCLPPSAVFASILRPPASHPDPVALLLPPSPPPIWMRSPTPPPPPSPPQAVAPHPLTSPPQMVALPCHHAWASPCWRCLLPCHRICIGACCCPSHHFHRCRGRKGLHLRSISPSPLPTGATSSSASLATPHNTQWGEGGNVSKEGEEKEVARMGRRRWGKQARPLLAPPFCSSTSSQPHPPRDAVPWINMTGCWNGTMSTAIIRNISAARGEGKEVKVEDFVDSVLNFCDILA